jgi:hypothetical protein
MSLFGDTQHISPTTESHSESDTLLILSFVDETSRNKIEESNHELGIGYLPQSDFDQDSNEDDSSDGESQNGQPLRSGIERKRRQRWQAHEIELAQSIDAACISDLNSNLLGASAERKRVQSHVLPPHVRSWQSRYRWTQSKRNRVNLPPPEWISWPLEPHEVPEKDEWFDSIKDGCLFGSPSKKLKPLKPSAELEEVLCAIALEKYRKKWETAPSAFKNRARLYEAAIASQNPGPLIEGQPALNVAAHGNQIGSLSATDTRLNESTSFQEESCQQLYPENLAKPIEASDGGTLEPVFSADDERSHRMLQPSIRSTLSKIDALLLGLTYSRVFHDKGNSYAVDTADQKDEDSAILLKDSLVLSESDSGSDHGSFSTPPHPRDRGRDRDKSKSRAPRNRKKAVSPPGLRDWSDILGIASLTGWNSDVVERAALRCARLFGEGMSFTTFREDEIDQPTPEPVHFHPNYLSALRSESRWTTKTLQCPHVDCPRSHGQKFTEHHRLVSHIRKVHKWDPITEQIPVTTVGGVKLDGFMQPIHARQGWRGKDKTKSEVRGVKRKKSGNLSTLEEDGGSSEQSDET